jgi:hypothetical protein
MFGAVTAWVLYVIYRRATRISVSFVPGPEPESFVLGNLPELFQSQVGEPDFKFQRLYGDVTRIKGPFGVGDMLNRLIYAN